MNTIDQDALALVTGGVGPGGVPPGAGGGGGGFAGGGGGGGGMDFNSIAKSSPSDWQPRASVAQPGPSSSPFQSRTPSVQGGPDQSWQQGLGAMFGAMGM